MPTYRIDFLDRTEKRHKLPSLAGRSLNLKRIKREVFDDQRGIEKLLHDNSSVNRYQKFLTATFFESADPYIRRRWRSYKKTHEPESKEPNFYQRMQQDQLKRSVIKQLSQKSEHRKA